MTIEELQVVISAEIADLKQGVQEASGEIEKLEKTGNSKMQAFGNAVKGAGQVVATAMKAAATAVAAGVTALVALSESTEEYRTNQAKLQTAFESAGASAEQATQTYNDLYRVLGEDDVAVEAAGHLAKLTQDQQSLSEWTTICQGVYATFGDSLPIESLTEAANETAKTGELTGALADALNWAGVSEDDFAAKLEACNSEAEREQLIRETLNGLYADAAATYEEQAEAVLRANEAQAQLNEALGALGEAVTPIVTIFKEFGAQILSELVPGLTQALEGVQGLIEGTDGAAEKLESGLGSVIDNLLTAFTDALPQVLEIGLQLIQSLIEGILQKLPEVVTTVMDVIPQITEAILGLLPDLLQCGIDIIVAIIDGLTQTVPQLLEQVVAILPEIIQVIIDGIPDLLDAAIEFFMAIVEAIPEIIPPLIDALPEIIISIVETLLEAIPQLLEAAIELFMAVVEAIPEIIPALVEALPEIVLTIIDVLIESIPEILNAAIELLMAVVDAIPEIIPPLIAAIPEIIITITKGLIEAVPKILEAAIKMFGAILTAIGDLIKKLPAKLGEVVTAVKTNLVEKLKSIMNFKWELPKLKLPKISISGKFSLNPPQVPHFSISWNKLGGVFDDPTIFWGHGGLQGIGEDGAEAVVPLEKNTQWMNVLADKLSERMNVGSNRTIVLQVDGKTLAETTISTINDLTRQTGSLSLVLV